MQVSPISVTETAATGHFIQDKKKLKKSVQQCKLAEFPKQLTFKGSLSQ